MKHIIVDLEMNKIRQKCEARRICTSETIEIGAVMLDDNLQEIAAFRTYIKPEYNDCIVPMIRKLTGITNEMLKNAPRFAEGFRRFTDWCLGTGDDITIYAWSNTDFNQIKKELILKQYVLSEAEERIMNTEWSDFQKEFDTRIGFDRQVSLKLALDMAGIDFVGREHDALDDARNTAELLHVFRDKELFDQTLGKIEEAMKPKAIGLSLGELINWPVFAEA